MKAISTLLFLLVSIHSFSQDVSKKDLEFELNRLKTKTVLVLQSQAIDEFPIWSENSDYIGCNIMGEWYKIRLTDIQLDSAIWRDEKIGILTTEGAGSKMKKKEVIQFKKHSNFKPREIITSNGTKIELKLNGFAVSLITTKSGEEPKTLWTSGGENCYSLSLSPDEKYVAYLCELNGLFIMKID